jgi:D-glycero-alpha-D-manno-heptose 1-phosphate guanylyltransferase
MDAIILVGGKGTRLQKVVSDVPKPLAPIGGVPFLDILLGQLGKYTLIKKVVLAVGYKSEMIIERYKEKKTYHFKIVFSVEKKLLGTGGAIKKALSLTSSEDVIILNGDTFVDVDFEALVNFHIAHKSLLTMVLQKVDDTSRYGMVLIDEHSRIKSFAEKTKTHKNSLINAGIYVINKILFENIGEERLSFEKDILPDFIKHDAYGYVVEGRFIDIGIPETYKIAKEYLRNIIKAVQ